MWAVRRAVGQARTHRLHSARAHTRTLMESIFSSNGELPRFELFEMRQGFADDRDPNKADLGVGAYRTEEGEPWVLPVVRKVEIEMTNDKTLDHEYLMFLGLDSFRKAATAFLLGENNEAIVQGRAFGIQGVGGTGSLRVGAEFLAKKLKLNTVYISKPTWSNHRGVLQESGFTDIREYHYWDPALRSLDFPGLMADLRAAPARSVVVLHACAHNPTGCDPTHEQWVNIADVMQERRLFPLFDCAYQGFASGNLEADAWAVRYFVDRGFELFCAQSFSKNFSLYNERVGNLTVVLNDLSAIRHVELEMMILIRSMYCNPPNHGMRIVDRVLRDPALFQEWEQHVTTMASRILAMRRALRQRLEEQGTPGTWKHITNQIGMFSFTGLTPRQAEFLIKEKHIYFLRNGRINMCGLNARNIDYVARAIHEAIVHLPEESSSSS